MNDLDILKGARKLIDDAPKLLKGRYTNGNGDCYCVLGAFEEVCSKDEQRMNYLRLENQQYYAELLGFKRAIEVVSFNDAEDTTKEDVLKRFDDAIVRLEKAE